MYSDSYPSKIGAENYRNVVQVNLWGKNVGLLSLDDKWLLKRVLEE